MAQLAVAGQTVGAKWTSGSIAQIEAGKFKATIENLVQLAHALTWLPAETRTEPGVINLRRRITVSDLLRSDRPIPINSHFTATSDVLLWFLADKPFNHGHDLMMRDEEVREIAEAAASLRRDMPAEFRGNLERMSEGGELTSPISEQERRAATDLGLNPRAFKYWALHLWRRSFERERDARAGEDANAQKRGRITRTLKDEIRAAYEAEHGND